MRFAGLTLCLLASSLGARAESVEERVAALEARVKVLEATLQAQTPKTGLPAAKIDGTYKATLPNGEALTVEFAGGKAVATTAKETKTATYEIAGQRVLITADGKVESLAIVDADRLRSEGRDKIEFVRTK